MIVKASTRELLGFDDSWILLVVLPLVAFLIPILFFQASLTDGLTAYLPKFGVSLTYTVLYWLLTRQVFIFFRKRYPFQHHTRRRILFTILAVIPLFFFIGTLMEWVETYLITHEGNVSDLQYDAASFTILALCASVYESIFLYTRWKESVIEREKLIRENVQSQLEGLRSQVNPHFLFNSLNTLTYLIPEDADRAVTFVQHLSRVYRYILEIRDKRLIPIREELRFLDAYVFLLQERFGENLRISVEVPESVKTHHIVPLSLQILFENAIKHNVISAAHPLHLEVYVSPEGNDLVVRNNLQRKSQVSGSTNFGLQNIKKRYAFFTQQAVRIEDDDEHFVVKIPALAAPATLKV